MCIVIADVMYFRKFNVSIDVQLQMCGEGYKNSSFSCCVFIFSYTTS